MDILQADQGRRDRSDDVRALDHRDDHFLLDRGLRALGGSAEDLEAPDESHAEVMIVVTEVQIEMAEIIVRAEEVVKVVESMLATLHTMSSGEI